MAESGDDGTQPPEPRKIHPIARISGRDATKHLRDEETRAKHKAALAAPVTTVDGYRPQSLEDARDSTARALGEILLQKNQLRRFRNLLRSRNDKVALAAYELAIQHILACVKPTAGADKPTQVIVNNLVARPPTVASSVTVEVT